MSTPVTSASATSALPDLAQPGLTAADAPTTSAGPTGSSSWGYQTIGGHMYYTDGKQFIGADPPIPVPANPLVSSAAALVPLLVNGSASTAQTNTALGILLMLLT